MQFQEFHWSPDGQFILGISLDTATVEVFSLLRPDWICRINCGLEGIEQACWSPNRREIITLSKCQVRFMSIELPTVTKKKFQVRVRVWSLEENPTEFPSTVKFFRNSALSLSGCGRYFATSCIEEKSIQIFNSETWEKEREISKLKNFSAPVWSPVSDSFALQPAASYKICHVKIFSAATGNRIGEFQREPGKNLRGSKLLQYSFCGQLLAVGCYDGAIFVLDHILWSPLAKFKPTTLIDKNCIVLRMNFNHYETVEKRPISFTKLTRKTGLFSPGVKFLEFNASSVKLASVDESMPAVVWIWDLKKLHLQLVVVCKGRIKSLAWGDDGSLGFSDSDGGITLVDKFMERAEIVGFENSSKISWQPGCVENPQFLAMNQSEVFVYCTI